MLRSFLTAVLLLSLFAAPVSAGDGKSEQGVISYYEIKPSLVANLASGGQYIRTDIQFMTKDEQFKEQLILHGPAIRHTLLLLLSEQDGNTIRTPDGKEELRQQALDRISNLMQELSGESALDALFFTTFFVQ